MTMMFASVFASLALFSLGVVAFNPYKYDRKTAQCIAVRRGAEPLEMKIDLSEYETCLATISYELEHFEEYVDVNPAASTTIMMVHGWPSLWSTWSKQIEEFEVCPPMSSNPLLCYSAVHKLE